MKTPAAPGTLALCRMYAMLLSPDGATVNEIVEETGMHESTVRRWMATMKAEGIAYRAAWQRMDNCRVLLAVWRFGLDQRDARRPKPATEAERKRKYRERRSIIRLQAELLNLVGPRPQA